MTQADPRPLILRKPISRFYGDFQALKEVTFDGRKGRKVVICGPSGAGKSTLIRCINGLERFRQGTIRVRDPEMIGEVLDVISDLAEAGMTMIRVAHETGFARKLAVEVVCMDQGAMLERRPPEDFVTDARHPRARAFVERIIR